jgi:sugar lactone lactonase YvrE
MLEVDTLVQGRYRIISQIGKGGMGTVYLARDENLGVTVAVKRNVFDDDRLIEAFKREARLLAGLRHSSLPQIKDYFINDAGQFLVMEYIGGDDFGTILEKRRQKIEPIGESKPFEVHEVVPWAEQLLDALDYLHTLPEPVIHRDIKPQNLKLAGRNQIILLDFGLAKGKPLWMTRVTTTGSIYGYTPNYAPLEQIRGVGTDPRSDLYALGATVYHLITGAPPVDAATRADAFIGGEPDPLLAANEANPKVPREIAAVLMKAMEQHRNKRPAAAAEMLEMLRAAKFSTVIDRRSRQAGEIAARQEDAWPMTEVEASRQAEEEARQEAERKEREAAERQQRQAEARQAQEEADRKQRLDEERRAREAAERRKQQEETARRAHEAAERKRKQEKGEEERRAREEFAALQQQREQEERERQAREAAAALQAQGEQEARERRAAVEAQTLRPAQERKALEELEGRRGEEERRASAAVEQLFDLPTEMPGETAPGEMERKVARRWQVVAAIVGAMALVAVVIWVIVVGLNQSDKSLASPQPADPPAGTPVPARLKAGVYYTAAKVSEVSFSDDGRILASAGEEPVIRLRQIEKIVESEVQLADHDEISKCVAVSPDGRLVVSGGKDKAVSLWNASDGRKLNFLTGHTGTVFSVGFSPDTQMLFSASYDKTIKLWRVSDGKLIKTVNTPKGGYLIVTVSPDLQIAGFYHPDGSFKLWGLDEDGLIRMLDGEVPAVNCGAFSPSDLMLALGSRDGGVQLWRVSDGRIMRAFGKFAVKVMSLAFTADNHLLAAGFENGAIRLWRINDGQLVATFTNHTKSVNSLSFSADGRALASGSDDHTVRIWDVAAN